MRIVDMQEAKVKKIKVPKVPKRAADIQLKNALDNAAVAIMMARLPRTSTSHWYVNAALRWVTVKVNLHTKAVPKVSVARKNELDDAARQGINPPRGVEEHAVPISLFNRKFIAELDNMTPESVVAMAEGHAAIVQITREEDERLRRAGLVKTMPVDWDGEDIYARYHAVGIEIAP